MRTPIRTIYFPDFMMREATLKKAILLFDEIHVTDRPSFTFGGTNGVSQFGTIGAPSPLRQLEQSFRDAGVPIYVHDQFNDYLSEDALAQVHADINDTTFLKLFQEGLRCSQPFASIQIAKGRYGEFGNEDDVRQQMANVNLDEVLKSFEDPQALFYDQAVRHLDLSTPEGRAKCLIGHVATCTTKLNHAINRSGAEGFIPFSDAAPYGRLLGQKYARAGEAIRKADARVPISDLSFAVLDEIVPNDVVSGLSLRDAVEHRKSGAAGREALMEQLDAIRSKLPNVDSPEAYEQQLRKVIEGEIRPAARKYRNDLAAIDEKFKVKLGQGALGAAGATGLVSFFANVSWATFLPLAVATAGYVGSAALDAWASYRAKDREAGISYLLALDD